MSVDIFTREQFETALPVPLVPLGVVQGEFAYLVPTINHQVVIEIRSSVAPSGVSRDCGEDSIRSWLAELVTPEFLQPGQTVVLKNPLRTGKIVGLSDLVTVQLDHLTTVPRNEVFALRAIGGKLQRWVTRVSGWQKRLNDMLEKQQRLAIHLRQCHKCFELLTLKKGKEKDTAYLFCPTDAKNYKNPGYQRHIPFTVLSISTGEIIQDEKPKPQEKTCPVCGGRLNRVKITRGPNAGKEAWSCPAKGNDGRYLNHIFEVIQE